jgi:hypothetical protein
MRKFILLLALIAFAATAFDLKECEHIYVTVESPEIKVQSWPSTAYAIHQVPPTGKHAGKEIVCVKCFKKVNQVVDYGEAKGVINLPYDTLSIGGHRLIESGHAVTTEYRWPRW